MTPSLAKSNIQADGLIDTSRLVNSITHTVEEDSVYVGTNVEYAIYQELGTGIYIKGGRKEPWRYKDSKGEWHQTNGVKPHHFLKRAVQDHVDEYRRLAEQELSK